MTLPSAVVNPDRSFGRLNGSTGELMFSNQVSPQMAASYMHPAASAASQRGTSRSMLVAPAEEPFVPPSGKDVRYHFNQIQLTLPFTALSYTAIQWAAETSNQPGKIMRD